MNGENRKQAADQNTRDKLRQMQKKHLDEKLDEALDGTFPASDPVELSQEPD